jgi:uncharacterized DUF497 family protein
MEIEFDTAKDKINLAKHGIPLRFAADLLTARHSVEIDDRFAYGEERFQATGEIFGRLYVCVYTMRGDTYRIISLRKATRREIDAHREG